MGSRLRRRARCVAMTTPGDTTMATLSEVEKAMKVVLRELTASLLNLEQRATF
jgi:hypothetical protein